jgi:hypothetical protein
MKTPPGSAAGGRDRTGGAAGNDKVDDTTNPDILSSISALAAGSPCQRYAVLIGNTEPSEVTR